MRARIYLLFLCFVYCHFLMGQDINIVNEDNAAPVISVFKTTEEIVLDGILEEDCWKKAQALSNFSQYFPTDSSRAEFDSEVYFTYDKSFLYIAAKCYVVDDSYVVSSLKRDYGFGGSDNISLLLDTYADKTNCYLFGMNPYGARREALISNGGKTRDSFDRSWDNKWDGESKMYDGYWICEMAIPFKILRYDVDAPYWRFNAYRNDTQSNETTSWINIPREFVLMDMNYMGELKWEQPLEKPGKNISLIPYASGSVTRDYEDATQDKPKSKFNLGGDAKIGLTSNLNLDLTANPDFSQVEVDRQVTNLDRFEIFFPERRQFFLENADLFARFGAGRINPFFSRRIGISSDTITGNTIQNTIYGGGRVAGKVTDKLRVGLISMQTAAQKENDLPSYNYSIVAAEQNVFARSSVAAIFANKQAFNESEFGNTNNFYNRVAGLEYRLRSANNYWTGKFSYLQAITPEDLKNKFSHFTAMEYNRKRYRIGWSHLIVGDGFNAEVGFVPRKDIASFNPNFTWRIFPNSEKIVQHSLNANARWIYKLGGDDSAVISDFGLEEFSSDINWNTRFTNNSRVSASFSSSALTLLDGFDPTRIQEDNVFFVAGSKFSNYNVSFRYESDRRKIVSYEISPLVGKFYGGLRANLRSRISYRYKYFGSISITANYNHIDLGDDFEIANLWLVGPRIDVSFSKTHFLTTFVQYNNQSDNLSINARYQWRFAPASDFFLVYSDNYSTDPTDNLGSRNRGLVAKLTYWLNL